MPNAAAIDLSGIFIPAATPFDPVTGDIDLVAFRANLRRWLEHPIRGLVVGGSTGEAVLLDRDERRALIEAACELAGERLVVAGTGAESTRETLRLTADAAAAGADAVLVQPPAYYRGAMTVAALRRHYRAVADASPVPVILYQVPLRFSTIELATGLVAELSEHPNIVGVKDSRGDLDLLAEYVTHSSSSFQVLVGNGAKLYASLEIGAVGGILGVANLLPEECAALHRAYAEGRAAEAGRIQERIGPVHIAVVGGLGVPGVKAGLDLLGMHGGAPRPPLQGLDDTARDDVRRALALDS